MILFIDNYDSFTYNIVQYLEELQQDVIVYKNDALTLTSIETMQADAIILGPGPNTPNDAGICLDIIRHFAGSLPIFGICLGHQAIGQAFGATINQAQQIMHGRVSDIYHTAKYAFTAIPSPFKSTRYHSLVVDKQSLPDCLQITAWTASAPNKAYSAQKSITIASTETTGEQLIEEIMGIRHKKFAIEGVQFHPESILSDYGYHLLNNFLLEHGLAKLDNEHLPHTCNV